MVKAVKNKWFNVRVDEELYSFVGVYIEATDMSMGDLIRRSVKKYMRDHPIEPTKPTKAS